MKPTCFGEEQVYSRCDECPWEKACKMEYNNNPPLCNWCKGSGEGLHDGTICSHCKGQGTER